MARIDPPAVLADAFGVTVTSTAAVIAEMNRQLEVFESSWPRILRSTRTPRSSAANRDWVLSFGARVLGEFGDDPTRYADAKARRNYAGTAPITIASGKKKVVKARFVGNHNLADACYR